MEEKGKYSEKYGTAVPRFGEQTLLITWKNVARDENLPERENSLTIFASRVSAQV